MTIARFAVAVPLLFASVCFGCDSDPKDAFPSDTRLVKSPECDQYSKQIGEALDKQIAMNKAAVDRQRQEFDSLTQKLKASSESEEQKRIAINNLSTRQDVENETRENKQNNEIEAIRERSRKDGCILSK
jgi:hypothetical protein